jgi:hypothetical protein
MGAKLTRVPPELVGELWPHVGALIKRAIDRTGLSDFDKIEAATLAGEHVLWIASSSDKIEAAATTQLITVAGRRICVIVACGGDDRAKWLPLIVGIERYAKAEGCAKMRIIGRRGWQRVLDGYRAKYAIMDKEF